MVVLATMPILAALDEVGDMPLDKDFEPYVIPLKMGAMPIADLRSTITTMTLQLPREDIHEVVDRAMDGPSGPIALRVYRPSGYTDLPLFIYLHGGAWIFGDLDSHDHICRSLCVAGQIAVVAIDYRLAPENKFPAGVEDALAAAAWIVAHAAELGCNADRIVIGGDSAGANLAAVTSHRLRSEGRSPFKLQILIYPATEFSRSRPSYATNAQAPGLTIDDVIWATDTYLRDDEDRKDPRAAPFWEEDMSGLPPAFVLTAELDPMRDDGEAYAQRLIEAGIPVMLRRYVGLPHGFISAPASLARVQGAFADIAAAMGWAFSLPESAPKR